jgi:hypothetical protein
MGKAWHHNYLYLFVWLKLCILFIFFLNGPSVIEHVLNWNAREAWMNLHTTGILSYTESCCLVPFSSNISSLVHTDTDCCSWTTINRAFSHSPVRYTTTKTSATKHAIIIRSCGCNNWQSEWGFAQLLLLVTVCVVLLNESWERNETALCMAKQQTCGFEDYRQAEKLLFRRCMCT